MLKKYSIKLRKVSIAHHFTFRFLHKTSYHIYSILLRVTSTNLLKIKPYEVQGQTTEGEKMTTEREMTKEVENKSKSLT